MFDPFGFFLLAKRLVRGDEAGIRTAVGRAYYAAFLLVRDKLDVEGTTGEIHRIVLGQLHSAGQHKIAQRLQELRMLRNTADYNTSATVTGAQASRALAWADFITRWVRQV